MSVGGHGGLQAVRRCSINRSRMGQGIERHASGGDYADWLGYFLLYARLGFGALAGGLPSLLGACSWRAGRCSSPRPAYVSSSPHTPIYIWIGPDRSRSDVDWGCGAGEIGRMPAARSGMRPWRIPVAPEQGVRRALTVPGCAASAVTSSGAASWLRTRSRISRRRRIFAWYRSRSGRPPAGWCPDALPGWPTGRIPDDNWTTATLFRPAAEFDG